MENMTKAELEAEIKDLKSKLEATSKVEEFEKSAKDIHNIYVAFMTAGFCEEHAWELTKNIINNGTQPKRLIF